MTAVTAWRTDEPCPVCATGLILHDDGTARYCGPSAACAAGPTPGPATTQTEVTSDRTDRARRPGRSGWPCRWPGRSSRTWPSSTAPASARSSCAAPTSTPARSTQVLVPCGHTLAHVCPSCAERARTLRAAQCREGWHLEDEPDLTPDPATEDQQWWVDAARRGPAVPRPGRRRPARTPPTSTSSSASWMRRSPGPASAGTSPRTSPPGGTGRPAAARTPRTCPAARSARARWARPTPRRTARRSARPCSSP